jgi:hypothetical protein
MSLAKRERPYYGVGGGVWVGIAEALHVAERCGACAMHMYMCMCMYH